MLETMESRGQTRLPDWANTKLNHLVSPLALACGQNRPLGLSQPFGANRFLAAGLCLVICKHGYGRQRQTSDVKTRIRSVV